MNIETISIYAAFGGIIFILLSVAASIGSALTQSDLSSFTSVLNAIGFGLMSFGAGGIIYVAANGG